MATAKIGDTTPKENGTTAAAAAAVDKATPHSRFLANLHNKYKEAIAAQQDVIEENYESADAIKKYNTTLKALTAFIKKNQMGIMLPTGESFKATMNPQMEDQVAKLKDFADVVKKNTEIQTKLYQTLNRLQGETKGSTKFVKTYNSLQKLSEQANKLALPENDAEIGAEVPNYARNISKALRKAISQATEQLQKDDTWIPKFIMSKKKGKQLSGPFDYTSSQYELLKQPGKDIAPAGQNFRMGASRTNDPYETIKLSEHLWATVDTLNRKTRADSTTARMIEMEKDMYGTYVHPGEGMGGIGGLPIPRGFQWKGTSDGVGLNKNKWQAGAGTFGWGGPPGPPNAGGPPVYTGQTINAYPIPKPPGPIGPPGGGGGGLGPPIIPIVSALFAIGKAFYDWPRVFADKTAVLSQPLEALYRAGTTTGQGTEATARFFSGGSATPTVSNYWSTLGFRNSTELYETQAAYGAQFRPDQAIVESAQLAQSPLTGFQSAAEYQKFKQRFSDMGLVHETGGMEKAQASYIEAVSKGVSKGISAEQVFKNINRVMDMMVSTGIKLDPTQIAQLAITGAGYATQTMRTGAAQTGEIQSYQDTLKNIVSNPFDLNTLMSESLAEFGTPSPSATQIEKMTGQKFNEAQKKYIEGNRKFAAGGSLAVASDLMAHENFDPSFMYDIRMKVAKRDFPTATPEELKYLIENTMTEEGAKTSVLHKMGLGTAAPKLIEGGTLPTGIPAPTDPDQWLRYLEGTHKAIVGSKDVYHPLVAGEGAGDAGYWDKEPIYGAMRSFDPGLSPIKAKFGAVAAHTRGFMYTPGGTIAGVPLPKPPSDIPTMGVGTSRNIDTNAINQSLMEADIQLGVFGKAVKDVGDVMVNVLGLIQRHTPDWGAPTSGGGFVPVPAHHPGAGTP